MCETEDAAKAVLIYGAVKPVARPAIVPSEHVSLEEDLFIGHVI